jgi:hypothetical protein
LGDLDSVLRRARHVSERIFQVDQLNHESMNKKQHQSVINFHKTLSKIGISFDSDGHVTGSME